MKLPERLRLAALACLLLSCPAWAGDFQPAQLMQLLAQKKSGTATFVEKKHIGVLDQPVTSSGNLNFNAPDKLQKNTLKPKPESLVLDGNMLTVSLPGKPKRTVPLEDYPEAAAFIEGIRGTLAGDLSALEKFYQVELSGSADKWQLTLTPKQERLGSVFSSIRISGAQADIRLIHLEQKDGDSSDMFIVPVLNP